MAPKFIDNNGIVSLGSFSCEKDLELKFPININPPPGDGRCNCYGKYHGEPKPWYGA